jgi:putative oxidoreductase
MEKSPLAAWSPRLLSVLRIVTGLLYFEHGTSKLFGFPHVAAFDHVKIFSVIGLAGILETVGGALVCVGLFTRPAAFILSGEMAFAYFMVNAPKNMFPLVNGGDPVILYCFIFLYLTFAGGGTWSVDTARSGSGGGTFPRIGRKRWPFG